MRAAVFLVLLLAGCAMAPQQQPQPMPDTVPAQALCSADGRLLGLRIEVPGPGVMTLRLPPGVCDAPGQSVRHRPI